MMLKKITDELKNIIIKLKIIIGLCLVLGIALYFSPLGQVKNKVEEVKEEFKDKKEDPLALMLQVFLLWV